VIERRLFQAVNYIVGFDLGDFAGSQSFDASKVRIHPWIGSVQGAVATWSVISTRYFLMVL